MGTAYDLRVSDCTCILCHDYGDADQRDRTDLETIATVRKHGWSVMMIPADAEGPGWAHTVGLWHTHRVPELAMFGLDVELMRVCLNDLAGKAPAGQPLATDVPRDDVIKNYPVYLKEVRRPWYRAFFGQAIGFYREPPFPFQQVVWPDREGHFHWDDDRAEQLEQAQPQLWLEPAEHPAGVWTKDL